MKMITGSLLDVTSGIICQQVNCQNAYGRGLSGVLASKWPRIEDAYHKIFEAKTSDELYGKLQVVIIGFNLYCANLFTQFDHGDARETHKVYTNMNMLVDNLKCVCDIANHYHLQTYVPYKIGCDLAGGDWNELESKIKDLPLIVVKLPGL